MNRKYFYLLIIGLLLISNLVLLYFALNKPIGGFNPDSPKKIVIEKLHFDDQQIRAYQGLIDTHRKEIKDKNDKLLSIKKELYTLLNTQTNDKKVDSLTTEMGLIQKQIEIIHYKHFLDIKTLCKPEQFTFFDELSDELIEVFNFRKKMKPNAK